MVEATDMWLRDQSIQGGWVFDLPAERRVAVEGPMGSMPIVVLQISGEHPERMPLAEYDDVIEALAADRVDDPFAIRVLPR